MYISVMCMDMYLQNVLSFIVIIICVCMARHSAGHCRLYQLTYNCMSCVLYFL